MNDDEHETEAEAKTLGLRCAWRGKILRQPAGHPTPDDHLAWTHGMCAACQKIVEAGGRR